MSTFFIMMGFLQVIFKNLDAPKVALTIVVFHGGVNTWGWEYMPCLAYAI
jgi:hypothetical protein